MANDCLIFKPKEILNQLKKRHKYAWVIPIPVLVLGLLIILSFGGCSLLKKGVNINPSLANQQGENDNNIVKMGELNALKGKAVEVNQTESIGGNKTITNDSDLLKDIFKYWWLIFVAIMGQMKWHARQMRKHYEKQVKQLELEKKDYKERYLAIGIKNEEDLAAFRNKHEERKNNG